MSNRQTPFHNSLHRPMLIAGIEKGAFGGIALMATFALVIKAIWMFVLVVVAYLLAKWLSKKDDQFFRMFASYLKEDHFYDSLPRPSDFKKRGLGWGRDLPR